jgi:thymidylate synthase (FAD)
MTHNPALGNMSGDEFLDATNMRTITNNTHRPISDGMEGILGTPVACLDHGFVRPVDYMGNDEAIVQMARVSYGAGTKGVSDDRGLIRYLMRHWHSTPFEGCEIKLHVKLPIFVARQWIRHRTANVNEYSARYSIMPGEFYIPDAQHLASQSKTNGQGRSNVLEGAEAQRVLDYLMDDAQTAYDHYGDMISTEGQDGLARELARMNLPVNVYTQWYWKIDLHNLFHFLRLRADPHAQYEVRVYAEAIAEMVKAWVPSAHEAFLDYRYHATQFSGLEVKILKQMINQSALPGDKPSGFSKGEWSEFKAKMEGMF